MATIVYTTPNCSQCDATKRRMVKEGVDYEVVDLSTAPDKLTEFKAQGYSQAPIVTTDTEVGSWSGFRPDLIRNLRKSLEAAAAEQTLIAA